MLPRQDAMVLEQDLQPLPALKQSRVISKVLSPAIRLWLRSQVDSIEGLQFQIEGSDRQILAGHVAKVAIAARSAVYQGFHLSQVCLSAEDIRINLGQVLKGKPLRLLAIVPVRGEVLLQESDLNHSLQVPLLANALTEVLMKLLRSSTAADLPTDLTEALEDPTAALQSPHVLIRPNQLLLCADLVSVNSQSVPLMVQTDLRSNGSGLLQLEHPELFCHPQAEQGLPLPHLHGFEIDLGSDVELQELRLEEQRITCRGRINVIPVD
jgi:hypothetical protein